MAIGGLLAAFLVAGVITAPATPTCLLMIHNRDLLRITGAAAPVALLPEEVNALGFHQGRETYYGITHSHLISISPTGTLTRLMPTPQRLRRATAGAIHEDHWFVRAGGDLNIIDLKDLSFSFVRVEAPAWGDFGWYNGLLYAIESSPARLVALDPASGQVHPVARLTALPENGSFGALEIDADGVVHAFHNLTGRLFNFPLAAPERFTVAELGPAGVSDFAGCPRPGPSPSPSPAVPPSPSPSPTREIVMTPLPLAPPLPDLPSPSRPPPPSPQPVLRAAGPATEPDFPERRPVTRTFFVGMLVPAVIVAARGIGRRR